MNALLKPNTYYTFSFKRKKYVFLSGSQRILEITNPTLDAYFKICNGEEQKDALPGSTLAQLTNALAAYCTLPQRHQTEQRQKMLTLNVTSGCNMACKYCFATTSAKKKAMPLKVAEQAIRNMLENNPADELFTLYFFGGEPLLHKAFIKDVVAIAKNEIVVKHGKRVSFMVNTNGTLMDDGLLEFFKKEDFAVTVSLDGPKDINDANRVYPDGEGSYEKTTDAIERLKKHHVRFNVRATIDPATSHLPDIVQYFEEAKVPYAYAFTMDFGKESQNVSLSDEKLLKNMDKLLGECTAYLTKKGLNGDYIYSMDFRKSLNMLKNRAIRLQGCSAGRNSLIVDEGGNYYSCQNMLPLENTSVGNVNEGVQDEKLNRLQPEDVTKLEKCDQCWAKFLCGGACMAERHFHGKDSPYLNQKCQLIQLEWKHWMHAFITLENQNLNKLNY